MTEKTEEATPQKKSSMKAVIIVESKAKTKSISKIVGEDYIVDYCLGHIYDLPVKELGIDIAKDFNPAYVQVPGKQKLIAQLKRDAAGVDTVLLATDPDREGESIAWHLARIFPNKKHMRMKFNEITPKAVKEALGNLSEIDMRLVDAQQARRVLDRLVGYQISPLLWKNLKPGLSAGRVQTVALRLICDREREIEKFVPEEYWSLTGLFSEKNKTQFPADFYGAEGKEIKITKAEEADALVATLNGLKYAVGDIKKKPELRRPLPPYTTSTLQQDSARRLGFSASKTMTIAQQLYEGVEIGEEGSVGLITYMRTDSVRVSVDAQAEAKAFITEKFGAQYVPASPNVYKTKSAAQDAHEAIRPSLVNLEPARIASHLSRDQKRLYELIWRRFLASQAKPAEVLVTRIDILGGGKYIFRTSGVHIQFDGHLRIFKFEDEKEDAETKEKDANAEKSVPDLKTGDPIELVKLDPKQHFTKPPPRYNEGSLVKTLEEKGIGRPSTFVPTIETIKKRDYVTVEKKSFKPTKWGSIVTDLLTKHFHDIFDFEFTARMEDTLDSIESGEEKWREVVSKFYGTFSVDLESARKEMRYEEPVDEKCEKCGANMVLKPGKYGLFLSCSKYPECKSMKPFGKPKVEEPTGADAQPPPDVKCPKCEKPMVIRNGRYGRFLACSGFPRCRTTEPYAGDFPCPTEGCGGRIVRKTTKSRKIFFGCSEYPKCNFVTWTAPLDKKCPDCNTFLVHVGAKGKNQEKCANPKCAKTFDAPAEAAEAAEATE